MNGIYTDGPFPLSGILSAANPSDMITASLVVIIPIHHKLPHLYRCGSLLLLWKFGNNTQMISGVQIDSISLLTGVSDILTIVLSFSIFFSSLRYPSESFLQQKKRKSEHVSGLTLSLLDAFILPHPSYFVKGHYYEFFQHLPPLICTSPLCTLFLPHSPARKIASKRQGGGVSFAWEGGCWHWQELSALPV